MEPKLILNVADLGRLIRQRRKEAHFTQAQMAAYLGCGVRFVSELERGKQTVELGKVLVVLAALGLELHLSLKGMRLPFG